jgi:hypothetical protein
VQLSQFDWGGPGAFSSQPNKFGYWELFSTDARYRVTLRFQKAAKAGIAIIKYKGIEKNTPILEGKSSVIFDDIELPAGPGRFEAFLKYDPLEKGVQFVEIERIN